MKIIIESIEDKLKTDILESTEDSSYDDIFAMLMSAMDGYARAWLKLVAENREKGILLEQYELFTAIFEKFLSNVFPEILPADFDLTSAAIVKAQDDIIADAEARGVTFEEALEEYRKKAELYIEEKKSKEKKNAGEMS